MHKPVVYFRADGNDAIGLGHVIRCCALAYILQRGFDCTFFIREPSDYLIREIKNAGCKVVALSVESSLNAEAAVWSKNLSGKEIIVLDGYHFDTAYQQCIKASGCMLVSIDDIHNTRFLADVIINHAGGTIIADYDAAYYTQFFLGFRYSLLRSPFLQKRIVSPFSKTLLICMGGADPGNDTLKVFRKVASYGFNAVHLLVGGAYRFLKELNEAVAESKINVVMHQGIPAAEVALLMQQCSHAVLSPSSIILEYISFGGIVYLHQIADNQTHIKNYLLQKGMAYDFDALDVMVEQDERMLQAQQQEFDGASDIRLLRLFEAMAIMKNAVLVQATSADAALTFEWANDNLSRQMSYNKHAIAQQEHVNWFTQRIADPQSHYFILKDGDTSFAQIRFDYKKDFYLISYFIAPEYRSKSLGSFVLAAGLKALRNMVQKKQIVVTGYVKQENVSSCVSFERMAFKKENTTDYPNSFKYTLLI